VSGSGISWAICKSAPCSRQTTTPAPHHSVFYRPDALPAAEPTAPKHWRHYITLHLIAPVCSTFRGRCCAADTVSPSCQPANSIKDTAGYMYVLAQCQSTSRGSSHVRIFYYFEKDIVLSARKDVKVLSFKRPQMFAHNLTLNFKTLNAFYV